LVRTTDPRELAIALVTQMRVPYRIAYAFFIALRIIPTIEEEIKTIRAAQAVRGVVRQRSVAGRIGEAKRYAIPLLVGSLRKASMMVMSMESPGRGLEAALASPPRRALPPVVPPSSASTGRARKTALRSERPVASRPAPASTSATPPAGRR